MKPFAALGVLLLLLTSSSTALATHEHADDIMAYTESVILSLESVESLEPLAADYDAARQDGDDIRFLSIADDLSVAVEQELANFDEADVRTCFVDWYTKRRTVYLLMLEEIRFDVQERRVHIAAVEESATSAPGATETPAADAAEEVEAILKHIRAAKGFFSDSASYALYAVQCEGDLDAALARAKEWQEAHEPTPEPAPAPAG
jgi:hypothetical protein